MNMDLVVRVARAPRGGETLQGHSFFTNPGGKGANQAVACARQGARVAMVGCVGDDDFGKTLRSAWPKTESTSACPHQGREHRVASSWSTTGETGSPSSPAPTPGEGGPEALSPGVSTTCSCSAKCRCGEVVRAAQSCAPRAHRGDEPGARAAARELWPLVDILAVNEIEAADSPACR